MRRLFPLALVLAGCAPAIPVTGALFDPVEVVLGDLDRPTVLAGFWSEEAVAEIAVVTAGPAEARRFSFADSTWVLTDRVALGAGVAFVDVMEVGGRDRFVVGRARSIDVLDLDTGDTRGLAPLAASVPALPGRIPHIDVSHDVTGDGRDDLVVPTAGGWAIAVQTDEGFAAPVTAGAPPDLRRIAGADGARLDPWRHARVFAADIDGDGRPDLAALHGDRLRVHRQRADGLFEPGATSRPLGVAAPDAFSTLGDPPRSIRAVHSIADLTGDGVADALVYALDVPEREADAESRIDLHRGTAGAPAFEAAPARTLRSGGRLQLAVDTPDLDGDGAPDLVVTSVGRGALTDTWWSRLKGAMGDDVWLTVELYRADDGGLPAVPTTTLLRALDAPPSPSEPGWVPLGVALRGGMHARPAPAPWARAFDTVVRVGDVTGDGLADVVVGDHPRLLTVHRGDGGLGLLAAPVDVAVPVPNDGEHVWLTRLDRDAALDVVLLHPFWTRGVHGGPLPAAGTESVRVVVLRARGEGARTTGGRGP